MPAHQPRWQATRPASKAVGEALASRCTRPLRFKSGRPRKWPRGSEAGEQFLSRWEGMLLGSVRRGNRRSHWPRVCQRSGDWPPALTTKPHGSRTCGWKPSFSGHCGPSLCRSGESGSSTKHWIWGGLSP